MSEQFYCATCGKLAHIDSGLYGDYIEISEDTKNQHKIDSREMYCEECVHNLEEKGGFPSAN